MPTATAPASIQAGISDPDTVDRWVANGEMTVIPTGEIDMEAFISGAEAYFNENFEGEQLGLYKAIRATAP